jgi:hypothetical protein
MTDVKPPPVIPFFQAGKIDVQPSFLGALRGIWLLTWRSQLTWRRLPGRLALLLALPFLVYITTQSPKGWAIRHDELGNLTPPRLNRFFRDLRDVKSPIRDQQRSDLIQIFNEEYATTRREMTEAQSEGDADRRLKRQLAVAAACEKRILRRAEETLDEAQFAVFKSFEKDNRTRMEQAIRNHREAWGRTDPFYHWLVDIYFFIILPLSCIRSCGALTRDELQADTLGFLVTRPASRARLILSKYIAQLVWLQILLLVETLLLFAVGAGREIPSLGALLPLFVGAQLLAVTVWCALGTLLGQWTSRYMAIALLYGAIVEMGIGRIPTNINVLSVMRHLKILLSHNETLQRIYDWPTDGAWVSIIALAVAPILFMALAAALFSFVESLPASEMQK